MNKLTVLRCIYVFLFLFSFLNALKGQLHIAQGRVTERQRSDGTLGICMVHTIQRPVRATENLDRVNNQLTPPSFYLVALTGRWLHLPPAFTQGVALGWI